MAIIPIRAPWTGEETGMLWIAGPHPWQQQEQQQQHQQRPPTTAAMVQAPRQSNPYADRFKNKFVNAGSTVSDINARATVVMPKQAAAARSTIPPPIPMSQMPLYLQRQMPGFNQPIATSRDTANIQEVRVLHSQSTGKPSSKFILIWYDERTACSESAQGSSSYQGLQPLYHCKGEGRWW